MGSETTQCPYCTHTVRWIKDGMWTCPNAKCPGVLPTPPAPAMPDEVRELVKWAKFAQRVVANEEYRILWEQGNGLIAAVEAKYGGSR